MAKKMTKKTFSFFFILFFYSCSTNLFAEEKLLFAVDLVRHGDRNPGKEIPASPYTWKEGLGELTPKGMNQSYQLGRFLRKKYVDQYHLLPTHYHEQMMYVRSTDINRTLMSAESILLGLYPLGTGALLKNSKQFALVSGFQPIPIHTVSINQDKLLSVSPSKNIFSIISLYLLTHEAWKKTSLLYKEKFQMWNKVTGIKIHNFRQLTYLADNLYIRNLHRVPLPNGINQSNAKEIISLAEQSIVEAFKHKELTYPIGHECLSTIASYMKEIIADKSKLKYVLFLGHDSSIMAVMNTLGSPLNKIPAYSSDLNFSLWKNKNEYYVKITLNNQPVMIPGCKRNICSLEQFYKIAEM